jgi:hypothetical protein
MNIMSYQFFRFLILVFSKSEIEEFFFYHVLFYHDIHKNA